MRIVSFTATLLALLTAGSAQVITVSPTGPIRTLDEARDAARSQRGAGKTGPITITIHAGTYFLPQTLELGPEDSDTIWEAAQGELPIISGGKIISGWTKTSANLWTADVAGPYFYQLFVNGNRATRARTPNQGFLQFEGSGKSNTQLRLHFRGNDIPENLAKQPDAEIVGSMYWSDFRSPVVSVDPAAHLVELGPRQEYANEENARYFIENTPSALDAPGEWYFDRSAHKLSYIPRKGENMQRAQVIAAGLERLVSLQGKPEADRFVRNITFRGLTFAYTDWNPGPKGYMDMQAGMPASSTILAVGTINLHIESCTFAHSGGYGLELGQGSKHNQVIANEFYDLGAGAIKVGDPSLHANDSAQNYDNLIADNQIHDLGLVYAGSVAIWVLQSSHNQIVHNEIHDIPYTGISVGWTWGYGANQSDNNMIAFNDIHDIGKGIMSDLGGIYTLGAQPHTIIRNNLIHHVSSHAYGGWGIYLDEGASGILVENNIVYECQSAGFHQHYGRENVMRNNIFALNHEHELMRTRAEDHLSFIFENNIIYLNEGDVLGSNWTGGNFVFRHNLYYDTRGKQIRFANKSFDEWKAAGQDQGSVIADPRFKNVNAYNFQLQSNSPALSMGFQQIDLSTLGPRKRARAAYEVHKQ